MRFLKNGLRLSLVFLGLMTLPLLSQAVAQTTNSTVTDIKQDTKEVRTDRRDIGTYKS